MTFDRNNALCYGQGFFSPNLVAIEQKKNKTKQNKHFFKDTTISIGIENYMNFQNHPHPPPRYNIDVAQKICISRTISLHNIIIQIFRHPQISPSLMKKIHTPQFHHPPPFQNKTKNNKKKKKYLPKPLYLVPIYSLISHLYYLLSCLQHSTIWGEKKTLSFTLTTHLFVV